MERLELFKEHITRQHDSSSESPKASSEGSALAPWLKGEDEDHDEVPTMEGFANDGDFMDLIRNMDEQEPESKDLSHCVKEEPRAESPRPIAASQIEKSAAFDRPVSGSRMIRVTGFPCDSKTWLKYFTRMPSTFELKLRLESVILRLYRKKSIANDSELNAEDGGSCFFRRIELGIKDPLLKTEDPGKAILRFTDCQDASTVISHFKAGVIPTMKPLSRADSPWKLTIEEAPSWNCVRCRQMNFAFQKFCIRCQKPLNLPPDFVSPTTVATPRVILNDRPMSSLDGRIIRLLECDSRGVFGSNIKGRYLQMYRTKLVIPSRFSSLKAWLLSIDGVKELQRHRKAGCRGDEPIFVLSKASTDERVHDVQYKFKVYGWSIDERPKDWPKVWSQDEITEKEMAEILSTRYRLKERIRPREVEIDATNSCCWITLKNTTEAFSMRRSISNGHVPYLYPKDNPRACIALKIKFHAEEKARLPPPNTVAVERISRYALYRMNLQNCPPPDWQVFDMERFRAFLPRILASAIHKKFGVYTKYLPSLNEDARVFVSDSDPSRFSLEVTKPLDIERLDAMLRQGGTVSLKPPYPHDGAPFQVELIKEPQKTAKTKDELCTTNSDDRGVEGMEPGSKVLGNDDDDDDDDDVDDDDDDDGMADLDRQAFFRGEYGSFEERQRGMFAVLDVMRSMNKKKKKEYEFRVERSDVCNSLLRAVSSTSRRGDADIKSDLLKVSTDIYFHTRPL